MRKTVIGNLRGLNGVLLAAFGMVVAPQLALGQAATETGTTLEDIVVTAQKREQSVNAVPMSIQALSGDALTQLGINDTSDLTKVVPGFTATTSNYETPVYTLRGIGLYDTSLGSSPAVSVYVDQVPLEFPVMTLAATLDLERVEVLKGPQGILFGQNSTGGAINYIAAKPTTTFETGTNLGYDNFGKSDMEAFVSGPLSDTLQARVAIRTIEGGAWQYSVTRPDTSLGDTREIMGRILLDWKPTDRLTFAFNFNGNQNKSDTQAGQLQEVHPDVPATVDPNLLKQPIVVSNARAADWTPSEPNDMNDSFYQLAVRVDYAFTDTEKLTSLTSYQNQRVDHWVDDDATALLLSQTDVYGSIKSFNQELRVTGDADGFNWVTGANYDYAKTSDNVDAQYGTIDHGSSQQPIPSLPPIGGNLAILNQQVDTYAAFGNLEYSFADHWSVYGGARFTESYLSAHYCDLGTDPENATGQIFTYLQEAFVEAGAKTTPVIPIGISDCFSLTPAPDLSPQLTGTPERLDEHNVSWRGGLDYKADGGALIYANASRGYKAGVVSNVFGSSTSEFTPAKQERVDAFEVGVKAPLLEHRMRVNAAVFDYEYADKQVKTREIDPIFGLLELIQNVPKSRIQGAELEVDLQPIPGLTLSANTTYLDSKVISDFNTVNQEGEAGNYEGSRLPYTPRWSGVADTQYEWSYRDVKPFVGASLTTRSVDNTSFQVGALQAPAYRLPGYFLIDLRAGVAASDDKWRIALYGRNVADRYYWTYVYNYSDTIARTAGRPATYGVMFSYKTK